MYAAGLTVESAKGECNLGQHEIAFLYDEVVRTCDNHVVYKNGAKEIAAQHGQSLTFMAKFDEREGNSCHIHMTLRGTDGETGLRRRRPRGRPQRRVRALRRRHLRPTMREFTLFYAPNINSYKRFEPGSFAPTAVAWGRDNRTCALRVVGHGAGAAGREPGARRRRQPLPRRAPAMLAGGLHGIERSSSCEPAFEGNAYASDKPTACPPPCARPATCSPARTLAREAFGDEVVDHYVNAADVELAAFNAAVTDWERVRGFERL